MSKFKKFLFVLAIIFAVVSFLALFVPYFINLDRYKPKIQELVSEKINAKLDYSTARLNFFGGIGIKLKNAELINTKAPFADTKLFTANDVDVRFEFIPLFSKQLIGTIYLDEPNVTIVKIGAKNNLESLEKSNQNSSKPTNKKTENSDSNSDSDFKVILNEFSVNDANITYKDLTKPSEPTIIEMKDIDINMIRQGEVFNIEKLEMTLFSGDLSGKIKIDTADPQIAYSGKTTIENFSLADIYHSFGAQKKKSPLNGTGNFQLDFEGRGTTEPIYSKALNGKGSFEIEEGAFSLDTTLPIIIDQIAQVLTSITVPNLKLSNLIPDLQKFSQKKELQSIDLSGFKGNFTIKNGNFLFKNNIPMQQGTLNLDLFIGLFSSQLKGVATFKATEAFTKELVKADKNFSLLLDKDDHLYLKIYLSGTTDDPKINVDTGSIVQNILLRTTKSILNPIDTIKDTIQKILPF